MIKVGTLIAFKTGKNMVITHVFLEGDWKVTSYKPWTLDGDGLSCVIRRINKKWLVKRK